MKNPVSESAEILITKSNSFQNFNLVVTTFGEAVSDRRRKGIQNTGHPINESLSTFLKALNTTIESTIDPF